MQFTGKKSLLVMGLLCLNGIVATHSHLHAAVFINQQDYQNLMPTHADGSLNYQLRLADKVTVNYHCNIVETPDGGFDLDRANCNTPGQFYSIDWQAEYPNNIPLNVLNNPSDKFMIEHKLWAIAFAHASAASRVQMQWGLKKGNPAQGGTGTFDLTQPFATGETIGNYFDRQMNPNYFVSKGLQESSLGHDLPDVGMSDTLDDDGVLQVEYPGSAWSELQGDAAGGFPIAFANMNPKEVLSSNNGPARNILGSALTSSFYNESAMAIVSGSLPWDEGSIEPGEQMHLFLQQAKDPDALSIMMSFMYNRGPYAAKQQPLRSRETFNHCASVAEDLEDDWICFVKRNDFGSRYIRQIPDVSNTLTAAAQNDATTYDTQLTLTNIHNYLDLLAVYRFYPQASIDIAKNAAEATFTTRQQNGSISYRSDFGYVLESIIVSLPIYELGEGGINDETSKKQVYFYNFANETVLLSTNDSKNQPDVNEYINPNNPIAIDLNGSIQQLLVTLSGINCGTEADTALRDFAATQNDSYESLSAQIAFTLTSDNQCSFTTGDHQPPPLVLEGYWDPAKVYGTPGEIVIDALDCKQYRNEWYVTGGSAPSVAFAASEWAVWRLVSNDTVDGCVPL